MRIDARQLIAADLAIQRRARAQHFRAGLALVGFGSAGLLAAVGVRPDLLRQPPGQIALQLSVWALALTALPAIGLGLWFPAAHVSRAIAGFAVLASGLVALGPDLWVMSAERGPLSQALQLGPCLYMMFGSGALALAVCTISGAFTARRGPAAGLWIAGAVALVGVDTTSYHCTGTHLAHTLPSHLGGGLLLLLLGVSLRRLSLSGPSLR